MSVFITLCMQACKQAPEPPTEYPKNLKRATFFDAALLVTLFVVGILAIIFGGLSLGHVIPIVKVWGAVMLAGGIGSIGVAVIIALIDLISYQTFTHLKNSKSGPRPTPAFRRHA